MGSTLHYKDSKPYENLLRDIANVLKNRQEVFIQHYLEEYAEPEHPPIWMIVETLSLGTCSKLFSNITSIPVRKKISEVFNIHPTVLESWMKTSTCVRNLCAHHARLWNRWFMDAPIIPKNEPNHDYFSERNRRFIIIAYILVKMLNDIAPKSLWKENLFSLFEKYPSYPGVPMGFSAEWKQDPFWKT